MVVLNGCAIRLQKRAQQHPVEYPPVVVQEESQKEISHQDETDTAKKYVSPSKQVPTSKVVLALLSQAEAEGQQGHLDTAISTIERALRIQPRNAELWHQLARYRLQQGRPALAQDLAKKSNSLAGKSNQLKRKNWLLISAARKKLGDIIGASEARTKAGQY